MGICMQSTPLAVQCPRKTPVHRSPASSLPAACDKLLDAAQPRALRTWHPVSVTGRCSTLCWPSNLNRLGHWDRQVQGRYARVWLLRQVSAGYSVECRAQTFNWLGQAASCAHSSRSRHVLQASADTHAHALWNTMSYLCFGSATRPAARCEHSLPSNRSRARRINTASTFTRAVATPDHLRNIQSQFLCREAFRLSTAINDRPRSSTVFLRTLRGGSAAGPGGAASGLASSDIRACLGSRTHCLTLSGCYDTLADISA